MLFFNIPVPSIKRDDARKPPNFAGIIGTCRSGYYNCQIGPHLIIGHHTSFSFSIAAYDSGTGTTKSSANADHPRSSRGHT